MKKRKAFRINFCSVILKGCLFHFGQTLFKNFVKVGLKEEYLLNSNLSMWFKCIFTLSLLPENTVEAQFEICVSKIVSEFSETPSIGIKCKKFIEYFQNNFLNSNKFDVSLWNHFLRR